jgi:5-methylcytosine-specific restriction endonuclease McrA
LVQRMSNKKLVRQKFRNDTFRRDKYRCVGCGKQYNVETAEEHLDAHHIHPRELMPNGGYVKENGASLCKTGPSPTCHEKAEFWLKTPPGDDGYSPSQLYTAVGSSYEEARQASSRLS